MRSSPQRGPDNATAASPAARPSAGAPSFPADALHGPGVFETLKSISELVLRRLSAGAPA